MEAAAPFGARIYDRYGVPFNVVVKYSYGTYVMPMGMSLVLLYEELNKDILKKGGQIDPRADNFSLTLLLGIAYGASRWIRYANRNATKWHSNHSNVSIVSRSARYHICYLDAFRAAYEFYIHDDCLVFIN